MKKIILISLLIFISTLVFAEITADYFKPDYKFMLFNPNKLTMNHSFSFMSGFSSNNQGFYQSVYTNHLNYQFNSKLDFKLDLNFVNYGSTTFQNDFKIEGNNDNTSKVLPSFQLNYKPSENTKITFEFRQFGDYNLYNSMNKNW